MVVYYIDGGAGPPTLRASELSQTLQACKRAQAMALLVEYT